MAISTETYTAEKTDTVLTHEDADQMDQQIQAEIQEYHRLHPMLWEKHAGEYVAIYNQKLVDHDVDKRALYKRVHEKYPKQFVLLRCVEKEPERDIHTRYIRLVQEGS